MSLKIWNIGICNAEIVKIEEALGMPPSDKKIWNIGHANKRLAVLEAELAAKGAAPTPSTATAVTARIAPNVSLSKPSALPATMPAAPAVAIAAGGRPSREQCLAICASFRGIPAAQASVDPKWNDQALWVETERACFQARLRVPGMRTESELEAEYFRMPESFWTGLNRVARANTKAAVARILTPGQPPALKASTDHLVGIARVRAAIQAQINRPVKIS